jgi:hypothetical protein
VRPVGVDCTVLCEGCVRSPCAPHSDHGNVAAENIAAAALRVRKLTDRPVEQGLHFLWIVTVPNQLAQHLFRSWACTFDS